MRWYVFLAPLGEQNIIWIFVTSGCLLSRIKYDGLSESVAFAQNWGILQTRMDQRRNHMKMNFDNFQRQKWVLQTLGAEKVDEKNRFICLASMFPSWVMALKLSKKVHFCNFVLTSARNLSLLKQCTYMHLKVLITLFQKMIWFLGTNSPFIW